MDPTGAYLIIGAPNYNELSTDNGRAILYTRSGSVWTEGPSFTAGLFTSNTKFGFSVTINATADIIIFGTGAGASFAYISYRTGSTWSAASIIGDRYDFNKYVNFSVDGLFFTLNAGGTIYIYKNTTGGIPGTWTLQAGLSGASTGAGTMSDVIVRTGKRYLMIGSKLFEGLDTSWTLVTTFTASNGTNIVDGPTALNTAGTLFYVGGYRTVTSGISDSGAVYEFAYT
jgi:hypothetical protein